MLRNHPDILLGDYSIAFRIIEVLKTKFGRVLPHYLHRSRADLLARLVEVDYKGRLAELLAEVDWSGSESVQEALAKALQTRVAAAGKRCWGDKSPNLQAYLPELLTLLPDARIVHIVRDGRATALSMHQRAHQDLRWSAQQWVDGNLFALQYQVLLGEARLLIVRYEDLLTHSAQVMQQICSFLGLEFHPAVLSPASRESCVTAGKAYVAPKLKTDKIDRYRQQLNAQQLRQIERIQGPLLRKLNYTLHSELAETDFRYLSVGQQVFLRTKDNFRALFRANEVRLVDWQEQKVAVPFRKRLGFFVRVLCQDLLSRRLFDAIFNKKHQQLP